MIISYHVDLGPGEYNWTPKRVIKGGIISKQRYGVYCIYFVLTCLKIILYLVITSIYLQI